MASRFDVRATLTCVGHGQRLEACSLNVVSDRVHRVDMTKPATPKPKRTRTRPGAADATTATTVNAKQGRAAQKEGTQQRILEVARAHFERYGYDGASFRGIADEAGVAAGTVVLHFVDKRGLLHAALHDDLASVVAQGVAVESEGTIVDRLAAVVAPAYAYYACRPALSRTLLESALFADPPWRERFGAQAAAAHQRMVVLATEAKTRRELARDADPTLFATAAMSLYYATLLAWCGGGCPEPLVLFRAMVTQQLRGVAPRTSRPIAVARETTKKARRGAGRNA